MSKKICQTSLKQRSTLVDRLRQSYLPQSFCLSSALSSIAPCILNLTPTSPATGKPGFGWANEKKTRHAMAVPNARNSSGRKSLGAGWRGPEEQMMAKNSQKGSEQRTHSDMAKGSGKQRVAKRFEGVTASLCFSKHNLGFSNKHTALSTWGF